MEFKEFNKIPRLSRECTITEKCDGTNASLYITEDGQFLIGSRTRWMTPEDDNFGFAKWAMANKQELLKLGVGHHFGEWVGCGIQRNYGLKEKRFYLFNTSKWNSKTKPECCYVVPVLYQGIFSTLQAEFCIEELRRNGSVAVPNFSRPEGIVIYHTAANMYFKKTLEKDEMPKSFVKE